MRSALVNVQALASWLERRLKGSRENLRLGDGRDTQRPG